MSLETKNIEQLVELCQSQNQAAQFEMYKRYCHTMYNVALRIVKDEHFAEDVMQEGFLKAFLNISDFKKEVTFGAWLKRIIINCSIDFYKKNNRLGFEEFDSVSYKISEEEREDNSDYIKIKAFELLQTMNELKENYRIILTLILIEGFDYEEVCTVLKISYANCRTTYNRAKEQLKLKIEKNEER